MRPALQALAEQQQVIDQLKRIASQQNAQLHKQSAQIGHLTRGLQALAQHSGAEQHVAAAMLRRTADDQNPAQPVPSPASNPATQSTPEVKTPEAFADVSAPGLVDGSTNDVAADATTTAYTPGQDVEGPAFKNLVDVTAPVEGTEGPRPLSETKTLTDVRVGDPMNAQTAFPLRGDFADAKRTSAVDSSNRTMASLRLAKLHIQAGLTEETDEFTYAAKLEKDASQSTSEIEREISTLENVKTASLKRQASANKGLVPRSASGVQRTTPSMQGGLSATASADSSDDDSDLFL